MRPTPLRSALCRAPYSQVLAARQLRPMQTARQQQTQRRARASETDVGTAAQDSLEALDTVQASSEARTSRSDEPAGPDMPFGLLLALASAGAIETAYLTLVRILTTQAQVVPK